MWNLIKYLCYLTIFNNIDNIISEAVSGKCNEIVLEDLIKSITDEHRNTKLGLHKLISVTKRLSGDFCDEVPECPADYEVVDKKSQSLRRRLPTSCAEALRPNDPDGVYLLYCPGFDLKPFYAFCMQDPNKNGSAWTVILRRQDNTANFYRYFESYKYGFGPLNGNHWLGLDAIHAMTYFQPHELWIKLTSSKDEGFAKYSHFCISSGAYDYELNAIAGFSGNIKDSLTLHAGHKFSTRDKDFTEENCSIKRKGAWWFFQNGWFKHHCAMSNLNGQYGVMSDIHNKFAGIRWEDFSTAPINFALMAIRPRT